jgi:hypothetical protein
VVTIKGKYNLADVKAAQGLHAHPSLPARLVGYYLLGLLIVALVGSAVLALMKLVGWSFVIYPAFILGGVVLFRYFIRPNQIARAFDQNKELSSPFEMELTDAGYGIRNSYGNGQIPWKDFVKWKEDNQIILLYRTNNSFNMIPKRLLQDDGEINYIREQLSRNQVKPAGKIRQPVQTVLWIAMALLVLWAAIDFVHILLGNLPH